MTQAASLGYDFQWTAVRGTLTANSTSLGAFTILPNYWSIQSRTGVAPASLQGEQFDATLIDPTLATTRSSTYPAMTGVPVFAADLYLPYVDPSDPTTALLGWYHFDPNSPFTFNTTVTAGTVRYNGSYSVFDPLGNSGTVTLNGAITLGSGDPRLDSISESIALRTATSVVVARISGTGQAPEPGTFVSCGAGGALLLGTLLVRRRRTAKATTAKAA